MKPCICLWYGITLFHTPRQFAQCVHPEITLAALIVCMYLQSETQCSGPRERVAKTLAQRNMEAQIRMCRPTRCSRASLRTRRHTSFYPFGNRTPSVSNAPQGDALAPYHALRLQIGSIAYTRRLCRPLLLWSRRTHVNRSSFVCGFLYVIIQTPWE